MTICVYGLPGSGKSKFVEWYFNNFGVSFSDEDFRVSSNAFLRAYTSIGHPSSFGLTPTVLYHCSYFPLSGKGRSFKVVKYVYRHGKYIKRCSMYFMILSFDQPVFVKTSLFHCLLRSFLA